MDRELTDARWAPIAPPVPGEGTDPGRSGADDRPFVGAAFGLARNGARWRSPPAGRGAWHSVHQRFSCWCRAGVWAGMLEALAADPVLDLVIIDATIVRAHRHAAGAKGGPRLTPSAARAAA